MWFYRYAIFYKDYPESKKQIDDLLAKGITSPGWYLKDVLEVAKKRGHPYYAQLCKYEEFITT